jgi:hypothetical protein
MIEAYLDESGIHDDAIVCVIAGFFGGRGQWKKFEYLWRKALSDFEVPLDKFHATDLIRRKGFFSGWKDKDHSDFLESLSRAITTFKIHPVSIGLVIADFNCRSHAQRRLLTGARLKEDTRNHRWKLVTSGAPGKPYFCPFQECVAKILEYTPVGGKAHFFFGLDRSFYKYAAAFMKELVDDPYAPFHDRIGTTAYPKAKETPQLQAADFFSYLTYVDFIDRVEKNSWKERPPDLLASLLMQARSHSDFQYYEKESIQIIFENTYKFAGKWDAHEHESPTSP